MTGTMISRLLWVLLNIFISVSVDGAEYSKFLYKDTATAVVEQTEENDFETNINAPRLVEFYSPFCGACRNFKRTYDSIAQQFSKKHPEVKVYAVSCAAHKDLCSRHKIVGYPTLYAFSADTTDGIYLKRSELGGSYDVSEISKILELEKKGGTHKSMIEEVEDLELHNNEMRGLKLDAYRGEGSDEDEKDNEEEESDEEAANKEKKYKWGDKVEDKQEEESSEVDDKDDEEEEEKAESKSEEDDKDDEQEEEKDVSKSEEEEDEKENETEEKEDDESESAEEEKEKKDKTEEKKEDESESAEEEKEKKDETEEKDDESESAEEENEKEDETEKKEEDESKSEEDKEEEEEGNESKSEEEKEDEDDKEGKSDQEEEDEDSSEEDEIESPQLHGSSKSKVSQVPAGAAKAVKSARDMDKWSKDLLKKRQEFLQKQQAKKKAFLGRNSSLSTKKKKSTGPGEKVKMDTPARPGNTQLMRANTPGTPEFQDRKKKILERIAKAREKKGLKALNPFQKLRGKPKVDPKSTPLVNKAKLPFKREVKKPSLIKKQLVKVPVVKRLFKMSPEEALIHDASLSLMTGLKHGVFISDGPLDEERKHALTSWLELLSVSLPPEWGLHTLIDELLGSMKYVSKSRANLENVLKKHPAPYPNWSPSCNGNFSCGMWKLLHIITLGVAEHRGGVNLVDSGMINSNTRTFTPAEAADILRDYIANFFGCDECRLNFLAQYDQCSFRRCDRLTDSAYDATPDDWKQLALWMWEVHNDVNVIVAKKKTGRVPKKLDSKRLGGSGLTVTHTKEDEIKVLFPSLEDCIVCFEDNGHWDEDSVFEYLERTYWDSPDAKYDRLLTSRKIDDGEDPSGGGMIWFMMLLAVAMVFSLRKHLNGVSSSLRFSTVSGVKQKLGDAVAGKTRTA